MFKSQVQALVVTGLYFLSPLRVPASASGIDGVKANSPGSSSVPVMVLAQASVPKRTAATAPAGEDLNKLVTTALDWKLPPANRLSALAQISESRAVLSAEQRGNLDTLLLVDDLDIRRAGSDALVRTDPRPDSEKAEELFKYLMNIRTDYRVRVVCPSSLAECGEPGFKKILYILDKVEQPTFLTSALVGVNKLLERGDKLPVDPIALRDLVNGYVRHPDKDLAANAKKVLEKLSSRK